MKIRGAQVSVNPSGLAIVTGTDVQAALADLDAAVDAVTAGSYTDEQVRDVIAAALVAGSNVTLTVNDPGNTITISATGTGGGDVDGDISTVQMRRGTTAAWAASNPVLDAGEPGMDTDTGEFKIGDGVAAWDALWSFGLPTTPPTPFDPTTIGTLEGWYEADALLGAGVTLPSSGTPVSTWTDLSGNARDLVQATSGSRPAFTTGGGGGQPYVQLDGSNDVMGTGSAVIPIRTVICVARVTAAGFFGGMVSDIVDNGEADGITFVQDASTDNWYNGGFYGYTRDGASTAAIGKGDGNDHIYEAAAGSAGALTGLQIGLDRSNGGRYVTARIYALLIYSTTVSSGDLITARAHFQAKYGTP